MALPFVPGKYSSPAATGIWKSSPPCAVACLPGSDLDQGPLQNHCRPAVDVLFRSAVEVYGSGVLAVVLTGMGSDGLDRVPFYPQA